MNVEERDYIETMYINHIQPYPACFDDCIFCYLDEEEYNNKDDFYFINPKPIRRNLGAVVLKLEREEWNEHTPGFSTRKISYKGIDYTEENYYCGDCKEDCDTFMVHDNIWESIDFPNDGRLCLNCFEKRLGRKLKIKDFTDAPCNEKIINSLRS